MQKCIISSWSRRMREGGSTTCNANWSSIFILNQNAGCAREKSSIQSRRTKPNLFPASTHTSQRKDSMFKIIVFQWFKPFVYNFALIFSTEHDTREWKAWKYSVQVCSTRVQISPPCKYKYTNSNMQVQIQIFRVMLFFDSALFLRQIHCPHHHQHQSPTSPLPPAPPPYNKDIL